MIHYIVSRQIADKIGVKDLNMFLLGAVLASDTGNKEDGSYCKLHYMDIREDIAVKGFNWALFVNEHSDVMSKDYYKGYCCHLIMDALWFHDVCDKHIRHLPKNIKAEKIKALYRDYWRLNHLLLMRYNARKEPIKVGETPDKDIDIENLLNMAGNFEQQMQAPECSVDELETLTWDIVSGYVEEAKEICLREITAILSGKCGMNPLDLFVPIAHKTPK